MIINLGEPKPSEQKLLKLVGGKAANLMKIKRADKDIKIPPGFVITTTAFFDHCKSAKISTEMSAENIASLLREEPINSELRSKILEAVKSLSGSDSSLNVAVRSSATEEDLSDASFAGQQESYLSIKDADSLFEAVKNCWASAFTVRAEKYRKKFSKSSGLPSVAVLIQQMVDAKFAGVAFSEDPMGTGTAVVECISGLGEDLVSGKKQPLRFNVKSGKKISDFKVLKKTGKVSKDQINDETVLDVAFLSVKLGRQLKFIADIEWAVDEKKSIHILQARAVTSTIRSLPINYVQMRCSGIKSAERNKIISAEFENISSSGLEWSVRPLNERIVMPMSPWETSNLHYTVEPLFRTLESIGITFQSKTEPVAVIFGRPYINVTILKEVFAEMPEIVDMLISSGHTKDSEIKFSITSLSLSLAAKIPGKIRTVAKTWEKLSELYNNDMDQIEQIKIADLDYENAVNLLDDILNKLASISMTHFQSVVLAEVLYNVMVQNLQKSGIDAVDEKATALISGSSDNATLKTNTALFKLADDYKKLKKQHKKILQEILSYEKLMSGLDNISEISRFKKNFNKFISEHGHRDPIHNFMFPSWKENPDIVLSIVTSVAELDSDISSGFDITTLIEKRDETEKEVLKLLKRGTGSIIPMRAFLFKELLRNTRIYMTLRENQQFVIGRAFPIIRQTLIKTGEILSRKGILNSPYEVFFLEQSELKDLLKDSSKVKTIKRNVEERMKRFYIFSELEPPDRISASNLNKLKKSMLSEQKALKEGGALIKGVGVSPGIYQGTARIIMEPSGLHNFKKGEILVCPTTNPAWTPIFPLAGAVVTDIGGMLSHGAVVAREYRIPAVLGTVSATERIQNGDKIEVDGNKGRVKIISIKKKEKRK